MLQANVLIKFVLNLIFFNMWSMIRGQGYSIFWWWWYPTEGESSNFLACRETPPLPKAPSLMEHSDLPTKKSLRKGYNWSNYCNDFEKSESIFFQSNKFTACNFKDKKEVVNSLKVFNLLKIIHPLQGKKHLRT